MDLETFAAFHLPALAQNEARHNLILAFVPAALASPEPNLRVWSLGKPGACATQTPGFPVVLGDLSKDQCQNFAEEIKALDYPAVVGPDETAIWFKDRATQLGKSFEDPIPQRIHEIRENPQYPDCEGCARPVEAGDGGLYADWITAFMKEAVPHDPIPKRETLEKIAKTSPRWFWTVNGEPVSVSGISRQGGNFACIAPVFTPPGLRGRGYAGAVTATVVDHALETGKTTVCLYTDLRNPYSNRCYQKIGFKPVCDSMHYEVANVSPS